MANPRDIIRQNNLADEGGALRALIEQAALSESARARIGTRAAALVEDIRKAPKRGLWRCFCRNTGYRPMRAWP